MKLKKWIQIILVSSSVITLAACSSKHKNAADNAAINDANNAYVGAQSSGLGEESRFGDQAGGGQRASAERVYYFDFDSDVVREEYKPAIDRNADYLASHASAKIMVEGHTDPRGSREYNIGLGERRAKAVAEILTARGVNPAQIRIVSYGAEKLATPGRTEQDFQLDRRAVLVYLQR
ncbi:OmpA family protein [Aquicella lusitana]|uniref:Peptidoglycan-associated lipoprotein n=1 Tax=Aquicella lusitana TaxID=254246 RepID=A0A370GDE9_9COXI|nr:OmpA family protein [Aquicella lusitana]RDI41818.1 peptidoglycan-associated lipoprotein [Aquicella lusitana]VVC73726.1 Peptidoglycan-associated lipoprotein [Aquicella lusitana]